VYTPMTLGELMEAQEGEGIQFKEALDKLWAAKHLNSPNAHVRV